ncbi:MAG TPA: hypothetical protein VK712_03655 [Verrucomicrobiae bacterium]|jgi:hypothetical protein|nr:hypothetical protein [Verrucomicrobiae bacterium]
MSEKLTSHDELMQSVDNARQAVEGTANHDLVNRGQQPPLEAMGGINGPRVLVSERHYGELGGRAEKENSVIGIDDEHRADGSFVTARARVDWHNDDPTDEADGTVHVSHRTADGEYSEVTLNDPELARTMAAETAGRLAAKHVEAPIDKIAA